MFSDLIYDGKSPRELAARHLGVRPGTVVTFDHGGRTLVGLVARITRRATVLVPDRAGRRYTDGNRYSRYYVPLDALRVEKLHAEKTRLPPLVPALVEEALQRAAG